MVFSPLFWKNSIIHLNASAMRSLRSYLDRHLVRCTTNSSGFDLQNGLHIFECGLENLERIIPGLIFALYQTLRNKFCSAVDFFPSPIIAFINLLTILLLYFGSGNISLFSATLLLGIFYTFYFGLFAPYFDLPLSSISNSH